MITNDSIENKLENLITNKIYKFESGDWKTGKYRKLKTMSPTEKGDEIEDMLVDILNSINGVSAELYLNKNGKKAKRGPHDIVSEYSGKISKQEVKAATLDTNGSFQFNGLKKNVDYTHAICFGIAPNKLYYKIVTKQHIVDTLTVHMAGQAAGGDSYKFTVKLEDMNDDWSNFEADIINTF